jgi:hypothetical protein
MSKPLVHGVFKSRNSVLRIALHGRVREGDWSDTLSLAPKTLLAQGDSARRHVRWICADCTEDLAAAKESHRSSVPTAITASAGPTPNQRSVA